MVSTKIRRLQRMNSLNESSLDENISLTEGILAEIKKREWFGKTAGWLHLLCFDWVCLVIGVLILLMSLAEVGLAMPPFIHAMLQDPEPFFRIARPVVAVVLLPFPLNLVLAIVKHFYPAEVEHSNGSSLEEKLRCLKENLKMIGERGAWEDFCLFEWDIKPMIVCTVACCLPALVGMGITLVLGVIEKAENIIIMLIGAAAAIAIFVGIFTMIFAIYILVGYKYLSILFGVKNNVRESAKRLLSIYDDYRENIRVDAMSPSERHSYIQKQAEKKERERRAERIRNAQREAQWEKDHKEPVVVDLDRVAAQAQAIYAASRGEYHLTTEDHEILDSINSMRDTYGDDWTKDM